MENTENCLNFQQILYWKLWGFFSAQKKLGYLPSIFSPESLFKNPRNVLKCVSHFSPHFLGLATSLKSRKTIKFSTDGPLQCILSTEKNLRWRYFTFSPKNVLENVKMSKNDIFQQFLSIYGGFETIWDNTEKPSNVSDWMMNDEFKFIFMHVYYRAKF